MEADDDQDDRTRHLALTRRDGRLRLRVRPHQAMDPPNLHLPSVLREEGSSRSDVTVRRHNSYFESNQGRLVLHLPNTAANSKEAQFTCRVPLDICREIVFHAGHIPETLATSLNSILEAHQFAIKATKQCQRTMATLCNLMLCCGEFRQLSLPALYQFVHIKDLNQLYALVNLLFQSINDERMWHDGISIVGGSVLEPALSNREDGGGYGRFIKVIDIADDKSFERDIPATCLLLSRLFSYAPKLVTLSGDLPLTCGWVVTQLINASVGPPGAFANLRKWVAKCSNRVEWDSLANFLRTGILNRLHTLRIRVDPFPILVHEMLDFSAHALPLNMPHLTGLCLDLRNEPLARSSQFWNFRSLRNLALKDPDPQLFAIFRHFVRRHAATITSLLLDHVYDLQDAVTQSCQDLRNLEQIIYNPFLLAPYAPAQNFVFPKLAHVCWIYTGYDPGDRQTNGPLLSAEKEKLESHLNSLTSASFPGIRTLQLLSDDHTTYDHISDSAERTWWIEFIAHLTARGIRMVDCNNRPIRMTQTAIGDFIEGSFSN